jgi:hypothetical protein
VPLVQEEKVPNKAHNAHDDLDDQDVDNQHIRFFLDVGNLMVGIKGVLHDLGVFASVGNHAD